MLHSNINFDYRKLGLHPAIIKALDYLKNTDFTNAEPGEYPIEGRKLYAKVFDNIPKPESEVNKEYHNEHLDIQFFVTGGEKMGYMLRTIEPEVKEIHLDNDLYLTVDSVGPMNYVVANPGDFIILYPTDIHQPGVIIESDAVYKKVVVKVETSLLEE